MNNAIKTSLLDEAYNCFNKGLFGESADKLDEALSIDFEDENVICGLKCANFWKAREKRLLSVTEPFAKGEFLLKEWKNFSAFYRGFVESDEKCLNSIRQWCFGEALHLYEKVFYDSGGTDAEILFRIGRCYKSIGDYENAISFLERTFQQKKEDSAVIAELADSYALINELKPAKIFFREAFFLDPAGIELEFLESMMIRRLLDEMKNKGVKDSEAVEWLPVYGVIYGVFNVKRELKPLELGKLKQSIFSYENRLDLDESTVTETVPRLLNYYFRLIDHYICVGEDRGKIEDILRKIKKINNEIFMEYIN
ncbi:MAG: tetratricopeptide repeat protein [Spirochaetales bacterium]|nr:tetratricopeptide repeat protein [Spirochaetales bacterium]